MAKGAPIDKADEAERRARYEQACRACERAQGHLESLLARLKAEYGCKDLASAKKKLAEMEREATRLAREYEQKAEAFDTEYTKLMED